mmetsp:Transcript_22118/g.37453  ORF Transcript_22118/g.37453 Transcript_22118/m.37453 type:complete len:335 (-) Transcript_22118:434-1438(-)
MLSIMYLLVLLTLASADDSWWLMTNTIEPTPYPSHEPSPSPTQQPSLHPTYLPTMLLPTFLPTTVAPTVNPTVHPATVAPTVNPTATPTTSLPTSNQITRRSSTPTFGPTTSPSTSSPTSRPTTDTPTYSPSCSPTAHPTVVPTLHTRQPTISPTVMPTSPPTSSPVSSFPTHAPTLFPTPFPTTPRPTLRPTFRPTVAAHSEFDIDVKINSRPETKLQLEYILLTLGALVLVVYIKKQQRPTETEEVIWSADGRCNSPERGSNSTTRGGSTYSPVSDYSGHGSNDEMLNQSTSSRGNVSSTSSRQPNVGGSSRGDMSIPPPEMRYYYITQEGV